VPADIQPENAMLRALIVACFAAVAAACGDPPSQPSGRQGALILAKLSGDSQSATVQSAVSVPPSVRVLLDGEPVGGVTVRFSVTSGNGSVNGPNVETDSLGIATVGAWILGARTGSNTLAAAVDSGTPVLFAATGTAGPPAKLIAAGAPSTAGTVGAAVAVPPAVRVTDAYDNPLQGVTVTFAVTAGGGSATGTSALSDSLGLAAVGSWTLGTLAGADTLTASATGLPRLTFQVIGMAGAPATVAKSAGDNQTANVRSPVDTMPAVVVRDAYGNPAPGVTVTFSVASGAGAVAGAAPVTDGTGNARVARWTLGPAAGTNTLDAAVPALTPVTFTATAVDRCTQPTGYALGSSVSGTLSSGDCQLPSGEFADLYSVSTSGTTRVRLDMTSASFISRLTMTDANGALVAASPYFCDTYCLWGLDSLRVLLPAGAYVVQASGFDYDVNDNLVWRTGPYTLSSAALPEDVHSCSGEALTQVAPGVTTAQRIDTTDCAAWFRSSPYYYDRLVLVMTADRTYTISMSSGDFDTFLQLRYMDYYGDGSGTVVASNDDFGGTPNSQITFTPTTTGFYLIEPGTYEPSATGAYTLSLLDAGAPSNAASSASRAGSSARVSRPRRSTPPRSAAAAFTPRPPKP
jgi:hypothetical protein